MHLDADNNINEVHINNHRNQAIGDFLKEAVFSDGTKTVEALLAPYQENNMGDCPKEYLKFHSTTEECRKKYEESTEKARLKDGTMVWPWDNILYRQITRGEYEIIKEDKNSRTKCEGFGNDTKYFVRDLESIEAELINVPFKELYPTFEEFMKDYNGENFDEEQKDWGYWENPNAKWDWYSIGGRWKGLLKAKAGIHGESSLVMPIENKEGRYSSAKVKDIDFTPDKTKYEKALRWWEVVIEDSPLRPGENKEDFFNFYKKEYLIKKYKDKETYARIDSSFNTYAVVLPDGTWCEKGKMGWWGCSSETPEESYDWDMSYKQNFIDKADPEWTLTIVDCHI